MHRRMQMKLQMDLLVLQHFLAINSLHLSSNYPHHVWIFKKTFDLVGVASIWFPVFSLFLFAPAKSTWWVVADLRCGEVWVCAQVIYVTALWRRPAVVRSLARPRRTADCMRLIAIPPAERSSAPDNYPLVFREMCPLFPLKLWLGCQNPVKDIESRFILFWLAVRRQCAQQVDLE